MEDSDVKIFKKEKNDDQIDEITLIAEMNTQRSNGNITKARNLGKYLASIFIDEKALLAKLQPVLGSVDFPKPIMFQVKILMFFTAEYCINSNLPNNILKNTAINALYDSIRHRVNEFYEEFADGAEYSFYYLAIRKRGNIAEDIGIAFSMLCGKEKDDQYTALGKKLWEVVFEEVADIINVYDFIK